MNSHFLKKFKRQNGSILLETLISIVILGLIVIGSFYSYSLVHQRIRFQRQYRIVLGLLQGWMERAISSVLDSNYLKDLDPDFLNASDMLRDPNKRSLIERDLEVQFKEEIYPVFYPTIDTNIAGFIDSNIVFIDSNIFLDPNDNMIVIEIRVALDDLPIRLYTKINL